MVPYLLVVFGICSLPFVFCEGAGCKMFGLLGAVILIAGVRMGYLVYAEGNRLYWQWYRANQSWRVAGEKRHTILGKLAELLAQYEPKEAAVLRDLSADRSGAAFLMQSFPNLYTIGQTGTLYHHLVRAPSAANVFPFDILAVVGLIDARHTVFFGLNKSPNNGHSS